MGHNFLPIFGFSFARCLTSRTNKQQLIILSRKAQSRDCTAAATWSEELPFVLLRLHEQPREDIGLSQAEEVFGAPIVLPNEFLQNEELGFYCQKFFQNFACSCYFFA
jgi:hypothetical protein